MSSAEVPDSKKSGILTPGGTGIGVFSLLLLNIGIYVLDHIFLHPFAQAMYLNHAAAKWWQFVRYDAASDQAV